MLLPQGKRLTFTGGTAITVVDAPGAGQQAIVPKNGVSVYNADSVAHDFTFQVNKGGTPSIFWKEAAVAAGTHAVLPKVVHLVAEDETLEAKIEGAHTLTAPAGDSAWLVRGVEVT